MSRESSSQAAVFASSSRETVVSPPSMDSSMVIQALVHGGETAPQLGTARFCFFCQATCRSDTALADHIRYHHAPEVRRLARNRLELLSFHACPFCSARFYTKSLLPQHLLQDHARLFSGLFRGSSGDYVRCPFCDYKVLAAFENLLSHHVDAEHLAELEAYLTANHSITMQSGSFLTSFCLESLPETPGLLDRFARLSTKESAPKPSTKRKLFSFDKENPVPSCNPAPPGGDETPRKTSCWRAGKSRRPLRQASQVCQVVRFTTSTPKGQRGPRCVGEYRCGGCEAAMASHVELVRHVRSKHGAIKAMLSPLYGCGQCDAVFYRSNFVERHRRLHHTFLEN